MAAEMTVQNDTETGYGVRCDGAGCAWYAKTGLGLRHATNSIAKHNRDHHPEPVLNLSDAARVVANRCAESPAKGGACLAVWQALTGLPEHQANAYLDAVLAEPDDVLVHVAPF